MTDCATWCSFLFYCCFVQPYLISLLWVIGKLQELQPLKVLGNRWNLKCLSPKTGVFRQWSWSFLGVAMTPSHMYLKLIKAFPVAALSSWSGCDYFLLFDLLVKSREVQVGSQSTNVFHMCFEFLVGSKFQVVNSNFSLGIIKVFRIPILKSHLKFKGRIYNLFTTLRQSWCASFLGNHISCSQ